MENSDYVSLTIAQALKKIELNEMALPLIQRNFVWDIERVTKLFDSILQGYPINSMLFWQVPVKLVGSVQMYRFIRNYTEFDAFEIGESATLNGERKANELIQWNADGISPAVYAVLDGQQRLTSFYMGLCGSYAYKRYYGRYGYYSNYPPRALYLCVSDLTPEGETLDNYRSNHYRLEWQKVEWNATKPGELLADPYRINDAKTELWLRIGEVLQGAKLSAKAWATEQHQALREYAATALDSDIPETDFEQAYTTLKKLHEAVHEKQYVSFYLDKGDSLARAVETFIRINSGGMTLGYSDLLFSIISSEWKTHNARQAVDELQQKLKQFSTGLDLEKGFILKAALVIVVERNIRFELGQFTSQRIRDMEQTWPNIEKAIVLAARSIADSKICFLNYSALATTIAFYCYKFLTKTGESELSGRDQQRIRQWLIRTRLMWSNEKYSTETKLKALISIINEHFAEEGTDFPFDKLISQSWGVKMRLSAHAPHDGITLDELVRQSKGHLTTKFLLGLLQSNVQQQVHYEIDHCFPHSESWKAAEGVWSEEYEGRSDSLPNLQLLPELANRSKGAKQFHEWYADLDLLLADEETSKVLKVTTQAELHSAHLYPTPLTEPYTDYDSPVVRLQKFNSFYDQRQQLIRQRLEELFADPE